jgi:threonine dehydrogenase-like Zn-dependent dehydrogenase
MMLALEMFRSLPRYVAARAVSGHMPGILSGPAAPLRLVSRDAPVVAHPGWARVRPTLSGICGSDLGAVSGATSLYFSALASMPFVPGHEVVGELQDGCEDLPPGQRVVLDPVLSCAARGVEACDGCATGATNLCDRVTVGHVAPGLQTGYCADTGGGWGGELMAHRSQLHPVPDELSDERAVLVEPLACAVHTALRAAVRPGASVLVSGAGAVGLFATLALRQLTEAGRITVVAKHSHQRELASAFGATDVVSPDEVLRGVRRATRAFRVTPDHSPEYLLGGVDVAVDAVGSKKSLDTVLRATRARGRGRAVGDAGHRRRPVTGVVPGARGRRLLRIGTHRARRGPPLRVRARTRPRRARAAGRGRRGHLSALPLARGSRPRALGGGLGTVNGGLRP